MEIITLDSDIKIFYVTAKSYPDGVLEAFQKLHSLIPFSEKRKYISVSRPENKGSIVYRAGASESEPGDLKQYGLDSLVITKGKYIVLRINNYKNNLTAIGKAFETLIHQPNIDPQGYCVEWYINHNDMQCMVRLKDQ